MSAKAPDCMPDWLRERIEAEARDEVGHIDGTVSTDCFLFGAEACYRALLEAGPEFDEDDAKLDVGLIIASSDTTGFENAPAWPVIQFALRCMRAQHSQDRAALAAYKQKWIELRDLDNRTTDKWAAELDAAEAEVARLKTERFTIQCPYPECGRPFWFVYEQAPGLGFEVKSAEPKPLSHRELEAEAARLKAENERLKGKVECREFALNARGIVKAEFDFMKAEVARLRSALDKIAFNVNKDAYDEATDTCPHYTSRECAQIAREALRGGK